MSLASSVRSLSGGVITFLDELTLLATQQPLSASQVDNFRLEAPFVSYLDGDIGGAIQKVGDIVKNNTLEVEAKVDQCAVLVTNSGQCKPADNSSDNQPFDESRCKALYELFECERDAACRLCDQVATAFFMQNRGLEKVAEYATCAQFGFKYTPECPSPMKTIILIVIGVLAVLGIGGGAFMMLRGGRKSGSRTGGINNKNQSSTGAGGGTSKSATKSAKAGSSTCGVITFLVVLTLLATQQPLLASQVDDSRLGAPFVSYLDGDIGGLVQKVGDTVKNNTLEVETKLDQCAALITNSGECKPVDNSTDFKLESESQCKARHEQFECRLDVVCRLCDQVAIAALVQKHIHPDSVKYYANCTKLGFEYKIECSFQISGGNSEVEAQEGEALDNYLICIIIISIVIIVAILIGFYFWLKQRPIGNRLHLKDPESSHLGALPRSALERTPHSTIKSEMGGSSSHTTTQILGVGVGAEPDTSSYIRPKTPTEEEEEESERNYQEMKKGKPTSVSGYNPTPVSDPGEENGTT